MQIGAAVRVTRVTASQTHSQVAPETVNGVSLARPIIVHGILCENPTGASGVQVTFEKSTDAVTFTTFLTITLPTKDSKFIPVVFMADQGVYVTTGAGTSASIFHSHPGR